MKLHVYRDKLTGEHFAKIRNIKHTMKLKFYALLFSVILTANLQAQQYAWSAPFGGGGEDVAGNIQSTGYFTDTGDFDPSEGTLELTSAGFYDCFVQKLNSSGQLEWVVPIGGTFFDYGTAIAADANENVYITGVYTETCDFDPSEAEKVKEKLA